MTPKHKTIGILVTGHTPEGGILTDRTVFYPTGGGQPGDGAGQWTQFTVTGDAQELPK